MTLFSCALIRQVFFYISKVTWLIVGALLFLSSAQADEQQKKNIELQQVQNKIEAQQASISKRKKSLRRQQIKLKNSDIEIGRLSSKMRGNKTEIKAVKSKIKQLKHQQLLLAKDKNRQQAALAKQLDSAYRTGNYDYLKVLLNQQAPEKIERTLTYYKYLNEARLQSLDRLLVTHKQIESNKQTLEAEQQSLEAKTVVLKEQKYQLATQKKTRESTLVKLKRLLGNDRQKLTQLQESEIELQTKIKRALQTAQKVAHDGLSSSKGKLAWPTKGRLVQKYGARHMGSLKRKGIIIAAPEGRLVNSVQAGQVVFANWLKGYGLIVVIDHGKGYLSLYAHNQSLLIAVGDRVGAGEAISTVGDSGGQAQSALYFELRYQGKPINPSRWLVKK